MPVTVMVTDAGGSPSARIQPLATARRMAAWIASTLSVPSLCWTLSTCVQVGGGRRPVISWTAFNTSVRNCAGEGGAADIAAACHRPEKRETLLILRND